MEELTSFKKKIILSAQTSAQTSLLMDLLDDLYPPSCAPKPYPGTGCKETKNLQKAIIFFLKISLAVLVSIINLVLLYMLA